MLRTRVIPCLLLRGRALVKTRRFKNPAYVGDPVNTVRIFNEKEVDELIVLDITATTDHRDLKYDLIEELATECFMPMAYGGGLRTLEQIEKVFSLGAEKVVLNTCIFMNPALVRDAAASFGTQSIVASIDVKTSWLGRSTVYVAHAGRPTRTDPVSYARAAEELGAGEILLTSIDRDGLMNGYDLDLVRTVADSVSIPVVACGGAGTFNHLADAVNAGASAVAAGSLFVYQGTNRSVLINFPSRQVLESTLRSAARAG